MAHHHHYSKRSRESRKAMTNGGADHPGYPDADDGVTDDRTSGADDPDLSPAPED